MFKLIHEEEEKLPRNKYIIVKIEFNNGESMYVSGINHNLNSPKAFGMNHFTNASRRKDFNLDYYKNNIKSFNKVGAYDNYEDFNNELKKLREEDFRYNELLPLDKYFLLKVTFPDNSTYYFIYNTYNKKNNRKIKNIIKVLSLNALGSGAYADDALIVNNFKKYNKNYKGEKIGEYKTYDEAKEAKYKKINEDSNSINTYKQSRLGKQYVIKLISPNNNTYYVKYKNYSNVVTYDAFFNIVIDKLVVRHFIIGYNLSNVSYFGVPQDIIDTNNKEKIQKWLKDNLEYDITGPYDTAEDADKFIDTKIKEDPNNINIQINRARKHTYGKEDLSESKHISLINLLYEIKINRTIYLSYSYKSKKYIKRYI